MLKKLFHSAIIGLASAAVILYVMPKITDSQHDVASYRDAVRIASPAVVNVYNQAFTSSSSQFQVNNLGSGVIMSKDGYILTNKHVIFDAALIGSDALTDLAVLKIKADNLSTIPQNPNRPVHVGDVALAIGNPYNLGQSVSQGIVSAVGRSAVGEALGRQNFIQTDASINRGNSGGALINSAGELLGISTLSIGKTANEIAEGLNFAIPIDLANDVMKKIIRDGRVIRGYFGVQTDILFSNGQGASSQGVLITSIIPNSPAAKAGLQAGDIILKINEVEARSPAEMMKLIADVRPNTQVQVEISRLGQVYKIPVIIEEYTFN